MSERSAYGDHAFTEEVGDDSWAHMFGFIPDGSRVLDVGCSTGNFAEALERLKSCETVGVDINEADVAEAATKIGAAYVLDIREPEALARLGTFDVVVFGDVIEHLDAPAAVLTAARELLNPGGRLVYSIPNMSHLSVRLDLLEGRFTYTAIGLLDHTHLHFYDRSEVAGVLHDAGFRVVEESPTVVGIPSAWLRQRLAAIGLQADQRFEFMLAATDADVFQFIGYAEPSDRPLPVRELPKSVFPQDEIRRRTDELIVRNSELEHEFVRLHERIVRLRRNPVVGILNEILLRRRGPSESARSESRS